MVSSKYVTEGSMRRVKPVEPMPIHRIITAITASKPRSRNDASESVRLRSWVTGPKKTRWYDQSR